jgi:hypothetical protein
MVSMGIVSIGQSGGVIASIRSHELKPSVAISADKKISVLIVLCLIDCSC